MEKFTIHGIPGSPFGRAVLAAFEEKGASYRYASVAPGSLRKPEHSARHPFGRVPADPQAAALPKAHAVFDEMSRLLGDRTYFVGEAVTLADLLLAPQLDFLRETPEWASLTANNPNLRAWLARMNERPSMIATTWERVAQLAKAA
jgi:glutathione S-transferase